MFSVTRELVFCYGHRLLNYNGKCRHLHGHNGKALITLEAKDLDSLGMVVDFSRLKQTVGAWIDENLDHKMVLHKNDPMLEHFRSQGEPVYIMEANPTAENIAKEIFQLTKKMGFPVVEVRLWETESCYATYRA
ncbi:MAG: 6-carboxytetrahydropterin synthase [Gemmataceae bacterium]|nr:6-carboxytetrahydropterin synthase [Gemmataceae bacterium]